MEGTTTTLHSLDILKALPVGQKVPSPSTDKKKYDDLVLRMLPFRSDALLTSGTEVYDRLRSSSKNEIMVMFYGPSGSGKTFHSQNLMKKLVAEGYTLVSAEFLYGKMTLPDTLDIKTDKLSIQNPVLNAQSNDIKKKLQLLNANLNDITKQLKQLKYIKVTPNNLESSRCATFYTFTNAEGKKIIVMDAPGSESPEEIGQQMTSDVSVRTLIREIESLPSSDSYLEDIIPTLKIGLEGIRARKEALGYKWRKIERATDGRKVNNPRLAKELLEKSNSGEELNFTPTEWAGFKETLNDNSYVEAGRRQFFKPIGEPSVIASNAFDDYVSELKKEGYFINVLIGEMSRINRLHDTRFTVAASDSFALKGCTNQGQI